LLTASNIKDSNTVLSDRELRHGTPYYSPRTTKWCVIDVYTIIIPTKCTRFLLLKSEDTTICNFVLYFCPYMFQPEWVIFMGLNASAWLTLLITVY
jgi:hypothetical protein